MLVVDANVEDQMQIRENSSHNSTLPNDLRTQRVHASPLAYITSPQAVGEEEREGKMGGQVRVERKGV